MAIVSDAASGIRTATKATILQLRAPDRTVREVEREATRLVDAVRVPVVISSRCDIAVASGAAGVNLPERDITAHDARALLRHGLVGRSVHSVEAAVRAEVEGADYVIFGPVWDSASHPAVAPVGIDQLSLVAKAVRIPVLAIGGVNAQRIPEILRAGAAGYAGISLFQ